MLPCAFMTTRRIRKMPKGLTPSAPECRIFRSPCIFKLYPHLRNVNDKAYEPLLLAIGPYNHGKDGLGLMEEHKSLYLQQMLQRRNEKSEDRYITALRELEGRARNCYAECISQTNEEFVNMMLLDGCFIIELFRKFKKLKEIKTPSDERDLQLFERDPIFHMDWMLVSIKRDLLLFENQLPFFILTKLFEMTGSGEGKSELIQLAFDFLSVPTLIQGTIKVPSNDSIDETTADPVPPKDATTSSREEMEDKYKMAVQRLHNGELKHLLDLMHTGISFSVFHMDKNHAIVRQEAGGKFKKLSETFKHLPAGLMHKVLNPVVAKVKTMKTCCTRHNDDPNLPRYFKNRNLSEEEEKVDWTLTHSATELREAGVKFKKAEEGNIFGIKFNDNGVLEVPPLTIDDNTETHLRNLIAYEQYSQDKDSHYATDYMCFLDDLINSPKDVEFLRRRGMIKNLLGDDEVASTMVNKLGHNVYLPYRSPIYAKTIKDLEKHCSRRRNVWMAKLRHNYFNSPWSLLSFLAAVLLLSLTFTQTLFSIIK